jgi:hypothetical protein
MPTTMMAIAADTVMVTVGSVQEGNPSAAVRERERYSGRGEKKRGRGEISV